ncbi:MAG: acyltransferase [Petrimonas sp.]|nr:acyltransferase [Petrimonas sp.]MEA5080304.1 acyltransferase [Dysgonamonadaceae bacterium]
MNNFWFVLFKIYYFFKAKINKKKNIYFQKQIQRICKNFIPPLRVNGPSFVNENTILGKNVNFNGMKINGKGVVIIGDNFHSGRGCKIITQIHNYEGDALPYDDKTIIKKTLIGDNVWFGDNVTVLGGIQIGEGVIIQAGSVVVNNIPDYSIAGGHPAKVFKYRDINHYNELKIQQKFH